MRKCTTNDATKKSAGQAPDCRLQTVRSLGKPTATLHLQNGYRELTRRHLTNVLAHLYADLTGLDFHVIWLPAPERLQRQRGPPPACAVCSRLSGWPLRPQCPQCGWNQLAFAMRSGQRGHRFTCSLGVSNFWFPITVRGLTVGVAFVQALDKGHRILQQRLRRCRTVSLRAGKQTKLLTRAEFDRAARLLRLIVQHVETSDLAELRKADLTAARRALHEHEREGQHLRQQLNGYLPVINHTTASFEPKPHCRRIVEELLKNIHQNYGQQISLRSCAAALGLNADYLSSLFSKTVGLPFKAYLTDLRIEKAKHLLGSEKLRISEVASAVGYSGEARFRLSFKKVTGLSPAQWRDTFRMPPETSTPR